jgi:alkylation response protein AidB-like acyl-CoA dehydrogenase
MDFDDTPEEAQYRQTARTWLEVNAPKGLPIGRVREVATASGLAAAKEWQAKKAEAGYACITWPKDWGGPGGSAMHSVIYTQEEARHAVPGNPFHIGLDMCVPTVMAHVDAATRELVGRPAMRGDTIWCQLFSEPAGGSDLGAVRTRAERSRDDHADWVLNGQKVWATAAHISDCGLILCRTNVDVPKHQGLTMFWLDMKAPGVDIRPIHEMDGSFGFNEVFLEDVRVPDAQRLGAVDGGWKVALFTLMNERLQANQSGAGWLDFLRLSQQTIGLNGRSAIKDQALREQLADWYVQQEGLRHTRNRTITALSKGQSPGPENSIIKLIRASQLQDMSHKAIEILEQYGIIDDPQTSGNPIFHSSFMWAPGLRIAGGTDEILRNIIAERVLGLPREPRADSDMPFRDLPKGR